MVSVEDYVAGNKRPVLPSSTRHSSSTNTGYVDNGDKMELNATQLVVEHNSMSSTAILRRH